MSYHLKFANAHFEMVTIISEDLERHFSPSLSLSLSLSLSVSLSLYKSTKKGPNMQCGTKSHAK